MRFLCLVHIDKTLIAAMTPEEDAALQRDSYEADQALYRSGNLIAAGPLEEPVRATLIRERNGSVSTTDGPYVETKEHVGGFMLIEAANREEAVRLATGSIARYGTIEMRESWELAEPIATR